MVRFDLIYCNNCLCCIVKLIRLFQSVGVYIKL